MTAQHSSDVNGSHSDPVHHPKHYNSHPSGIECVEYAELLPGNLSHTCVYVWRHADKGTPVQDLDKALWFLDREIGRAWQEQREVRDLLGLTPARVEGSLILDASSNHTPAQIRIQDRLRHLRLFVKDKEFVATVVCHLLRYELAEARKLIVHQRTHLALSPSRPSG